MQYNTGALVCSRNKRTFSSDKSLSFAGCNQELSAKLWLIECIDRLTPESPTASSRSWVWREFFTPTLIALQALSEGHLQHFQALVYVKKDILPHELQGFWVWPLALQNYICNSVQGDHGVYIILFTYTWATYQLAFILLQEKNGKFFLMCRLILTWYIM